MLYALVFICGTIFGIIIMILAAFLSKEENLIDDSTEYSRGYEQGRAEGFGEGYNFHEKELRIAEAKADESGC